MAVLIGFQQIEDYAPLLGVITAVHLIPL